MIYTFPDEKRKKDDLINWTPVSSSTVSFTGILTDDIRYAHKVYTDEFYEIRLEVNGIVLPAIVSKGTLEEIRPHIGEFISVDGTMHTKGTYDNLRVYFSIKHVSFPVASEYKNKVTVDGFVLRTPEKSRSRTVFSLKVPHLSGFNDLIPCSYAGEDKRIIVSNRLLLDGHVDYFNGSPCVVVKKIY